MKIGEIKENNIGLKFKILSKDEERSTSNHQYYNIEFLESGYTDSIRSDSINNGTVKDRLAPTSYNGIGAAIGNVNTREYSHEYKIWQNMIYRCYMPTDKSYQFYGAKGVTVCDRWLLFENFVNDIKLIPGFDQELFDNHQLRLDKDVLSDPNNKVYSPTTTVFISDLDNQKIRTYDYNSKHKKFAIYPDGHVEQIFHMGDFCKKNNLHRQNVTLCLAGKQKSTKGFKFYKGD